MRILQVDKFLRRQGGGASYMLDLAELQRQQGHTVDFFAMADDDNIEATYDELFPPFVALEPPPPGFRDRLRTTATMLHSRSAERAMDAVVGRFEPDIVHLHNIYHQLSPSILRPLAKRNIPIVMTVHDFKLVCPSYRMMDGDDVCEACLGGNLFNAARRRCKDGSLPASLVLSVESTVHRMTKAYDPVRVFISPSAFLADKLRAGGVYPERVRHIPNFVDVSAVEARTDAGEGVVFIGRLSREKGVDTLIEAIGSLDDEKLTIAGDGPERAELERLAEAVAPGRIRFVGHLSKSEVLALNRSARTNVLPARWYENMPMAIVEAMAASVPMIVTDMGGMPELIEDGVDGLIVPPDDPRALAKAIETASDMDVSRRLGAAARKTAIDRYDAGDHLVAINDAYEAAGVPPS